MDLFGRDALLLGRLLTTLARPHPLCLPPRAAGCNGTVVGACAYGVRAAAHVHGLLVKQTPRLHTFVPALPRRARSWSARRPRRPRRRWRRPCWSCWGAPGVHAHAQPFVRRSALVAASQAGPPPVYACKCNFPGPVRRAPRVSMCWAVQVAPQPLCADLRCLPSHGHAPGRPVSPSRRPLVRRRQTFVHKPAVVAVSQAGTLPPCHCSRRFSGAFWRPAPLQAVIQEQC